jgi:tetratricopeptide (TPR) repeat protein
MGTSPSEKRAIDKRVKELTKLLQEKDMPSNFARIYAEELGQVGEPALKPLGRLLRDKDAHVRDRAAHALGEIKDNRAAQLLLNALKDKQFQVREKAAESLALIGEPATDCIIQALRDKDPWLRRNVLYNLHSEYKLKEHKDRISALLKNPNVIEVIVQCLRVEICDQQAAAVLKKIVRWEPQSVDDKIYYLIAQWGYGYRNKGNFGEVAKFGKAAVEPLIHVLRYVGFHYKQEAIKTLEKKLNWRPRNNEENVYCLLAKKQWDALARLGEPAVEALLSGFEEWQHGWDWSEARETVIRIGKPALKHLTMLLKDRDLSETDKKSVKYIIQDIKKAK